MFWQRNGFLQHLHHHVVLLAAWTLAQRMQYLVPASPLLDHTNFCAALLHQLAPSGNQGTWWCHHWGHHLGLSA